MKKTVHIISHSHWDREWYLPYEKHHMRLIDLVDDVLEQIKNNPEFKFYNMDGHFLPIEDYLVVKPHKKEEIINAVKSGKLKIGPWYVLQDAFLTSSESNIRNMQYGQKLSKEYGGFSKVGYYPDTFGIYSQAPQILKKSNIDNMYFGRGVTPTGFNNQVGGDFASTYSEMCVKSPDGSIVDGILFANWYSNGNEIPTNKTEAKVWWDAKLESASKFAKTTNLLFMNGCDHQPLQKDITTAINVANELYPEIEFKHSNLEHYYEEIKAEFDDTLDTVDKELKSQDTDGYYTLVNTASSRVYQKIENAKIQDLFEHYVEPLSALLSKNYPHEKIEYGWKTLMKNHAHDSICGCSIDSVHRSVDSRFENAKNIGEGIVDKILFDFKNEGVDCPKNHLTTIINSLPIEKKVHEVSIYLNKYYFEDYGYPDALKKAVDENVEGYTLKDTSGNNIHCELVKKEMEFGYDLPDDKFRQPFYANKLTFKVNIPIQPYSYKTVSLEKGNNEKFKETDYFENDKIKVDIKLDGTFDIFDKTTKKVFKNQNQIFDQGDIGNEYMYGRVKNEKLYTINKDKSSISYDFNSISKKVTLKTTISLPKSADETLLEEKRILREFHNRNSSRGLEHVEVPLKIDYILDEGSNFVKVKVKFKNRIKDHRMRVRFLPDENLEKVEVDSIFDTVERTTKVSSHWKNDSNDQQLSKFILFTNNECNIIIATQGLNEYEATSDSVYLTLMRSVSEMGDWGHFETPEAQMIDKYLELNYAVGVSSKKEAIYDEARYIFNDTISTPVNSFGKNLPCDNLLNINKTDNTYITSVKRNEEKELIMRAYSIGEGNLQMPKKLIKTDLLEKKELGIFDGCINNREIVTIKIEE